MALLNFLKNLSLAAMFVTTLAIGLILTRSSLQRYG